jgi:hypothetical protein
MFDTWYAKKIEIKTSINWIKANLPGNCWVVYIFWCCEYAGYDVEGI